MTCRTHKLVFVAALVVAVSASPSLAQTPMNFNYYQDSLPLQLQNSSPIGTASAAGPASTIQASPVPEFANWPRPAEVPASLYTQAPVPTPYGCAQIPGPYFEHDPLVDPPSFPQPGWVADVEVSAVGPHLFQSLSNGVAVGGTAPGSIRIPITLLDWTVSPRLEVGYRLSEGFGAFMLSWQYIGTTGTGSTPFGPDGYAGLGGRLNYNLSDLDYVSREFTPWDHWGMQWRFGFRQVYMFYDTTVSTPTAAAAAGTGILQESGANGYRGWGGHVGVQLDREFNQQLPGLSLVAKLDFGDTAGFVQQRITQTTLGGGFAAGEIQQGQAAPSLAGQLGVSYRPPGGRYEFYLGGFYQYWWNVGTLPNFALNVSGAPMSGGELSLTGVTARFSFNY